MFLSSTKLGSKVGPYLSALCALYDYMGQIRPWSIFTLSGLLRLLKIYPMNNFILLLPQCSKTVMTPLKNRGRTRAIEGYFLMKI
jgi:hypothetical protein